MGQKYFNQGKVLIAAANPDMMESFIEKGDLVILGNRYESQLCAIEMEAACIIVCEGAPVSPDDQEAGTGKGLHHYIDALRCLYCRSSHQSKHSGGIFHAHRPLDRFRRYGLHR